MGTRIEFDREATQERLQVRMYELIVRYIETADRLIGKNPEMKRDAFLRDGELQKILLKINSIIGLMEG